jgi:hypothetical protein
VIGEVTGRLGLLLLAVPLGLAASICARFDQGAIIYNIKSKKISKNEDSKTIRGQVKIKGDWTLRVASRLLLLGLLDLLRHGLLNSR